jgi:hypothetical protein
MPSETEPATFRFLSQYITCTLHILFFYSSKFILITNNVQKKSKIWGMKKYLLWRTWGRASWYLSIGKPTTYMHNFRVYWISLCMFRTVFPFIIWSSRLYTQHQVYIIQVSWLLAGGCEMELSSISCPLASSQLTCITHIPDAVCTVLNSWWWTETPSETCRVIFNKLEIVHLVGFTVDKYITYIFISKFDAASVKWLIPKYHKHYDPAVRYFRRVTTNCEQISSSFPQGT